MGNFMGAASGISGMVGANMNQAASRKQLYAQAAEAEASIADVDLQASQRGEVRAMDLRRALGAIENRRAASGLDPDSPTAQAIEGQMRNDARIAGLIEGASAAQQRLALMRRAAMMKEAGYEAGRLLDLKFGTTNTPIASIFRNNLGSAESMMYGSGSYGTTASGGYRSPG